MTATTLSQIPPPAVSRTQARLIGRRRTGVLLLLALAALTSVALIPARAERVDSRPSKALSAPARTPPHC
jgi:hypothetical protein